MPGGLMNLVSQGQQNIVLNGNPTKSFFKSTGISPDSLHGFKIHGPTIEGVGEYPVTATETVVNMPAGMPSGIYIGRFVDTDNNKLT